MSGSSGLVVRDQTPWPSFSMRDSFTPSQWTWTLVADGAFRRKVTRPSARTSGETSGCDETGVAARSVRRMPATKKDVTGAKCEEIAAARGPMAEQGFIELVWPHSIAQTSARFKRKWAALAEPREAYGVRGACSRFGRPTAFDSGSKLRALQTLRDCARAKNLRSLRATWAVVVQPPYRIW